MSHCKKMKISEDALQKKQERKMRELEKDKKMLSERQEKRLSQRTQKPIFDTSTINNPLILNPQHSAAKVAVIVDPRLSDDLQKHQRDGVQKMYDVVSNYGARISPVLQQGFILADKMGLGKTVQTLAVVWTLLTQSPEWDEVEKKVKPEIKKVIIVAPKSVVPAWKDQVQKWLTPDGQNGATNWTVNIEILDDRKTADKKREAAKEFMKLTSPKQMLILSYETFVSLTKNYQKGNKLNNQLERGPLEQNTGNVVDLIVLDEAHLIKNEETQRFDSISNFRVDRKIVLTGTPLQNNLLEYHTLIDFVQPSYIVRKKIFEAKYQTPIMKYVQDKNYTPGKKMLVRLKEKVNPFFLRRTHNPFVKTFKTDYIVCCKMNEDIKENLQLELHNAFVEAFNLTLKPNGDISPKKKKEINAFMAIHFLKDVCCHPQMVYNKCIEWEEMDNPYLNHLARIFREKDYVPSETDLEIIFSPKLRVLKNLLKNIKHLERNDRVVIVSYYTHVLDFIEIMCKEENFNFVRFDGKTSGAKRKRLIDDFNNPLKTDQFVMTLSSRAGGCGISLIGANHLIMFDPDWNPANDDQVMSRIYRESQQKDCHIYRLLTTASIEEQIFHRQIVKKLLAGAVLNEDDNDGIFNFNETDLHQNEKGKLFVPYMEEMRDEILLPELCRVITSKNLETCLTHEFMDCKRCDVKNREETIKSDEIEGIIKHEDALELQLWTHHFDRESLPEECEVLYDSWVENDISFVFRKKLEKDDSEDMEMDLLDDDKV